MSRLEAAQQRLEMAVARLDAAVAQRLDETRADNAGELDRLREALQAVEAERDGANRAVRQVAERLDAAILRLQRALSAPDDESR